MHREHILLNRMTNVRLKAEREREKDAYGMINYFRSRICLLHHRFLAENIFDFIKNSIFFIEIPLEAHFAGELFVN